MWNFAKSAEAMFSRWAVKKVCKFVLKKKLGQFILGDIDVDQLDVQFAEGTIQLSDLALNVDFLNHKIGAATSMMIKEGSIGSLLLRMPWKGKGCEIEVDELEVVLTPRTENSTPSTSGSGNNDQDSSVPAKLDADMMDNIAKSTSKDVHEGVKTIAKMVKWLLTSFHVRIKRLIIVFDPCLEKNGNTSGCHSSLVLRISEIECGTGVSEDVNQNGEARSENFLGISQLTTYVKFQGAVLELLQMDDVDSQKCIPCLSESTYGDLFSVARPPGVTIPIMTGKRGGFSGSLKLSIPWKNGSLDIRKVDADAFVEPVELRFQPSTIKWLLISWEACKSMEKDQSTHIPTDSVFLDSASHFSSPISAYSATDKLMPACGNVPTEYASSTLHESATDVLLPGSRVISDWVPFFMNNHKTNGIEEIDFGASVDQFFECFDGMRSSQFGSSGMWNWTSSVVSAITTVSSLASGSLHVASEQQPVETNLKATLAGISVVFPFQDENQNHLNDTKGDIGSSSDVLYLYVECRDILLVMQVSSREMRVEGTMGCIEVANYSSYKDDTMGLGVQGCKKYVNRQTSLIQRLQADVHSALPLHAFSSKYYSAESSGVAAEGFPCGDRDDLVRITVLKTSGVTYCQCTVSSTSSDRSLTRPTSFSLKLPHFVAWVDFPLLSRLLELLKDFGRAVEIHNQSEFPSEASKKKSGSSDEVLKRASSGVTTLSSTDKVRGDIIIPNARIIVCFRSNGADKVKGLSSWDQFIALEFSSPSTNIKGISQDHGQTSDASSEKRYSSTATRSLQLNVGNLGVFLVRPVSKDDVEIRSGNMQRLKLATVKVLSITNSKGSLSIINMLWQEGFVTGPWIAKKAKSLATFEESRSISKFVGKDHEFASVSTVKDLKDLSSQTRQEIILSSAFSLHVCLPAVTIKLDNPQYKELCCLLDQMMNEISGLACDSVNVKEESSISQTSILVNCQSFEVCISLDVKETVKSSLHSELPGSWHHLRLKVQKLEVLSVSNIGGIFGATFLWLSHGEGKLWGSITDIFDQEFLLITCSNSTMKRGDGGGSNVLSSMLSGSDIVHLWDPTTYHGSTSVTVRCATVVAVGGRLDWLDAICSFFIFSLEIEQAEDKCKEEEDLYPPRGSSFVLNLVDIGLSYEPYLKTMVVSGEDSESSYSFVKEMREEYVSCLLAASSLNLSTSTVEDSKEVNYKIRIQDLGLLLCLMSKPEDVGGTYSVEHLNKNGYIKVAREALIEANLRTNCKNGLLWEVECSKSHIFVETCHDTMSSLIRLAGQIQQLFAPDMEESVVHLQTRWNKIRQEQERRGVVEETQIFDCESSLLAAQFHMSGVATERPLVGLMDEISEDAFQDKNHIFQYDSSDSHSDISFDQDLVGAAYTHIGAPDTCLSGQSYDGPVPTVESESSQTSLQERNVVQLIEGYCLSELRPLSERSIGRQSSQEISKCKSTNVRNGDGSRESSGWYGTSARILENHIPETSESSKGQIFNDKLPSAGSNKCDDVGKAIGRVLLKNIDVRWRMVAGSHWNDSGVTGHHSVDFSGRDDTLCLELSLCGMEFQYDVFPVGGICVSKLSLSVTDFYLYDRSKDAPWKMVLGYYHSKDHPRKSSSKGFKLDLEAVRPDPLTPLEEYRLRVAFLPMLLHLHQYQLDFLISFFGEKSSTVDQSSGSYQDSDGSKALPTKSNNHAGNEVAEEAFLPYFQKFDIWPMLVRIDYSPSRVDLAALRGGKYVELVNLVPWKGVELQLKHVHAVGVYGWGSVCETIIGEWLEDISQNQIHKILHGLPTVRSLVAVGAGAAKLVSLPVEHYRKDKRVLKGMQRGTIAFLRSISLEAVGLGVHLAAGAHDILLQAEHLLTSIPPSVPWSTPHRVKSSARSNQPKDAQQGMRQAYESLSDGLGKSAAALVRTPLKKYERGAGAGSTFASAVRGVPAAAIAPASACASAVHCALLGFRNSLDRERKKESIEKYLGPPQPWKEN